MQNKFIFTTPSLTLTEADISGGFNYRQYINPDIDIQLGICAMGELRFTITDFNNISNTLAGRSFTWQTMQQEETVYKLMGTFTVDTIKKLRSKTEIIAYDNMIKFDRFVDSWLAGLSFPITLANMLTSLCTFCGVTLGTIANTITNATFSIQKNFNAANITGRTILSYICEAAGSFATIGTNGSLNIRYYSTNNTTLNNTTYISVLKADYTTALIDKLQIRSTTTDIGVISGTGTNVYIIENNPLLYATTASQIQTQATNIYNKIRLLSYRPMSIETFRDFNITCGDIITVDGQSTIIMEKQITQAGVKFISTGGERRSEQSTRENQFITRMAGLIHEFSIDIDGLTSRVSNAEGSVASLTTRVTNTESNISLVVQNGQIRGSMIISAINGESTAVINASRISLAGKTINLTSDNITIQSTNFSVDRYGNIIANNGTFSGIINANSGKILGKLEFGNNPNIYIDGTPNAQYILRVSGSQGIIEMTNQGGFRADYLFSQIISTQRIEFAYGGYGYGYIQANYNNSQFEINSNSMTTTLGGTNNLILRVSGTDYMTMSYAGMFGNSITFAPNLRIYFNGATIYY